MKKTKRVLGLAWVIVIALAWITSGQEQEKLSLAGESRVLSSIFQQQVIRLTSGTPVRGSCPAHTDPNYRASLCPVEYSIDLPADTTELLVLLQKDGIRDLILAMSFGKTVHARVNDDESFWVSRKIDSSPSKDVEGMLWEEDELKQEGRLPGTWYIAVITKEKTPQNYTVVALVKTRQANKPVADFTASPTRGPAPLTVQFTDRSTGDITSWNWDFGDGGTSTQKNPRYTYRNPGTFTVRLTVRGPGGEDTKTKSDYITVTSPKPVADFTASPTRGPAPLTVQFTDRSSGDITSYFWDFGDGGTSTDKNPRYTYNTPGKFTVKLTVRGPGGEDTKIRSNYIEVTSSRPTADFTANPTRGAAPLTVQFTDKSTGDITSWSWDFGDGGTSSEKNPQYTYRNPGVFTVKLAVKGPGGEDTKTRSNYITVIGPPRAPSDLTATARGQTQIDLNWRDNSDNEDGFEIFRKIQGQSYRPLKKVSANTKGYSDTGLSPGTTYCYQVRAYNAAGSSDPSNEACATTDRAVTAPVADFEANPTRGPVPLTVQFTDKSKGDITNWSWDFGDGGTSSEKNPSHTYRAVGTFTVKLTVRGPGGESSKTGTIEVTPEEIRSFEFEATAEQDKPATIPLPDNIKSQLPEGVTRFVEVPNTTKRGRTSSSLKDVGLDVNPDTGTIYGTPTKAGRFYFLIEARSDTAALAEIWAIITITGAGQPPPPSPTGGTLISGVPQKGTVGPGPKTLSDQFTITVLEGTWTLLVKLQNQGPGDINLHVRLGKPVEIVAGEIVADFSSTSPTGSESLMLAGPVPPGVYYIAVENMESTPQTFTILAAVVPVLQMINSGEPVSGRVEPAPLGGRVLALTQYVIEAPEGAKSLAAVLENLSVGAMKLHIRYGKPVELSDGRIIADFSSDAPLGLESITIAGTQLKTGKYYIAIENLEPYAQEFKLTVTITQ